MVSDAGTAGRACGLGRHAACQLEQLMWRQSASRGNQLHEIDQFYKISEVTRMIKASRATVYRLLNSGALESVKSRSGRFVTHSQLLTFVERLKAAQQ
jgi:hypothetical protein